MIVPLLIVLVLRRFAGKEAKLDLHRATALNNLAEVIIENRLNLAMSS